MVLAQLGTLHGAAVAGLRGLERKLFVIESDERLFAASLGETTICSSPRAISTENTKGVAAIRRRGEGI